MIPDFFSSFFSSYILLSITTLVILLGSIYLYINHRIADQDHKLSSMVNVIQGIIYDTQVIKSQLIHGSGDAEQSQEGGGFADQEVKSNVHVEELDEAKIVVSDNEYSDSESNMSSDSDSIVSDSIINVKLDMDVSAPELELVEENTDAPELVHVGVDVAVETNVDTDDFMEVKTNDFKKMPVGALRELVQEQGLCEDASKLKKPELLQLLA